MTTEARATAGVDVAELLGLFPHGTRLADDGVLVVGGCRLDDVAPKTRCVARPVDCAKGWRPAGPAHACCSRPSRSPLAPCTT